MLNLTCILSILTIIFLFLSRSIEEQNTYAIPCLLLAAWSLLLSALLGLSMKSPERLNAVQSRFRQLKLRLAKFLFTVALAVLAMLTIALLHLTLKLWSF